MFTPDKNDKAVDVPYFENAKAEDGWQGHATTKSLKTLQAEISTAIGRMGGSVIEFRQGKFQVGKVERPGFQLLYAIAGQQGRMDIAALPIKKDSRNRRSEGKRTEQSIRMALYMVRLALDGAYLLSKLSPGYAPLIPFMLDKSGQTVSELWNNTQQFKALKPPDESTFVDGEWSVADEHAR